MPLLQQLVGQRETSQREHDNFIQSHQSHVTDPVLGSHQALKADRLPDVVKICPHLSAGVECKRALFHSSRGLSGFCKFVARGFLRETNDKTQLPSVANCTPV